MLLPTTSEPGLLTTHFSISSRLRTRLWSISGMEAEGKPKGVLTAVMCSMK
jgi:hypothetical protein